MAVKFTRKKYSASDKGVNMKHSIPANNPPKPLRYPDPEYPEVQNYIAGSHKMAGIFVLLLVVAILVFLFYFKKGGRRTSFFG